MIQKYCAIHTAVLLALATIGNVFSLEVGGSITAEDLDTSTKQMMFGVFVALVVGPVIINWISMLFDALFKASFKWILVCFLFAPFGTVPYYFLVHSRRAQTRSEAQTFTQ
ncbi:hypothetical protein [Marinobacter salsuginis]|uniref:hypothetical protein n=1 Tax=Marinobacter salsuginis TaxID=418719 RepID=UPI00273F730D|nr:hypothetical protein [Marinobacter salsuginis]